MGLWNIRRHDKGQWVRRGAILGKGNWPWCLVMLVSMGGWCLEALSRGGDCQSNRSKVSRWVAELWPRMETGVGAEEKMRAQGEVQHNRNRARGHKGSLQRAKILILPELQIRGAISAKTHPPAAYRLNEATSVFKKRRRSLFTVSSAVRKTWKPFTVLFKNPTIWLSEHHYTLLAPESLQNYIRIKKSCYERSVRRCKIITAYSRARAFKRLQLRLLLWNRLILTVHKL